MEFSFDRSKPAQPQAQTQSAPQPQNDGPRPGPDLNTVDPSTIANERLRKAIERNRAKQGIRSAGANPSQPIQPQYAQQQQPQQPHYAEPVQQQEAPQQEQGSFFNQEALNAARAQHAQATHGEAPVYEEEQQQAEPVRPRMRARERVSTPPPAPESTTVVSRRSVAKPEDTEFVPVKRSTRKVASQISYTTGSTRKKQKSLDPKYQGWLVKGSWIFCAIMVLRLIFAAGGVTDFYSQKSSVNDRLAELSSIKKENMQLVREIERMRTDTGFQKKLVRDNLGFIAADEFLVLFPK